jgi:hypothetical protein
MLSPIQRLRQEERVMPTTVFEFEARKYFLGSMIPSTAATNLRTPLIAPLQLTADIPRQTFVTQ